MRVWTGTLLAFAVALVLLAGASARPGGNGGTLVIGLSRGDADSLDPTLLLGFSSVEVLRSMCERLYDFDARSDVVPVLASALPTISRDKLTYTVPLRRGLRFNDGTPFNAAAVVTTLDRDRTLPASGRASDLTPIATVGTRGPYTVVIRLRTPFSPLLATLATNDGIVMSPTQLAKLGTAFGTSPVCVGPFTFDSRVAGDTITVVKSPYYYDRAKVHLDRIVFKAESNAAAAVAALEAGDIQVLDSVAPSDVGPLKQNKSLRLIEQHSLGWNGIVINIGNTSGVTHTPYTNVGTPLARSPLLRRAFEEAISRKTLVRVVYQGAAVPDCTPIAPASPTHDASIKCTPYDPQDARKLVARSGYSNPTVHLLVTTSTISLQLAQFIQAEEAAVGINVVIDSADPSTQLSLQASGGFETVNGGWSGSPAVDRNVYQFIDTNGSRNYGGYSNPRVDRILDRARRSTDPKEMKALYHQALAIVLAARPIIFLDHATVYAAVSSAVKGVAFFSDTQLRVGLAQLG